MPEIQEMPEAHAYEPTGRTVPTRARERAAYDRELVHAILDDGYLCHMGFVRDGAPVVLPTLHARLGERVYVHGSTGSRPLRAAGGTGGGGAGGDGGASEPGLPVCLTVTHVDGLVLARSAFHHSVNYRSVMIHGIARPVTDPGEKRAALDALVDAVVPGRSRDTRPPNTRELAATAVLRLELAEVSAKVRSGPVVDEPEDMDLPYWAGVVPVTTVRGAPLPADDLAPATGIPGYLTAR
ncbi:pyridoxamine 5'-phosphate oxidase family protein [Streptomyces yaizuensis]|uniref:Pyridoxamine 5'-phosphate oxidase family protein n=1 Tax=Streptomyces yaizuensis TaxID=2989713 RepID=A0ABQ5P0I7_9ACTN|nr:pyridoxamine 5'-phosphate oxidase family protein [Streptomyces sp. YSPA8]GLF95736.1 pyridoxamine 5'-phosphate oxidase family protein [Streptomyces sp. YSPA8]